MADFPGAPLFAALSSGTIDPDAGSPVLTNPLAGPPSPPVPTPTITDIAPAPAFLQPTTHVTFRVTNATLKTVVWVYYANLRLTEVVWDGDRFADGYQGSARSVAGNVETFSVLRQPVWPGPPNFTVFAVVDCSP